MTDSKPHSRILPLGIAVLMAVPVVMTANSRTAEAQVVVRVGRSHHHSHIRVRTPYFRFSWGRWYRPRRIYRPRIRIFWGAPVYVPRVYYAGPFAQPPPPPPPASDCDCGNGPTVPIRPHYRVRVPPRAPITIARRTHHPKRLAIGAFAGHTKVENGVKGEDVGLIAQLKLSRRLTLEGEIGKTSLADNARVDKRVGVALMFNFRRLFSRSRLTPYILLGAGASQVDMDGGDWSKGQGYFEIGGGLSFRLTRSISLSADLRAGARALTDSDEPALVRSSSEPPRLAQPGSEENYTRFRFAALLHF